MSKIIDEREIRDDTKILRNGLLKKIQVLCRKRGHLSKDENLKSVMNADKLSLESKGYTSQDVFGVYKLIKAHHEKEPKYSDFDDGIVSRLISYNSQWVCQNVTISEFVLSETKFISICVVWGGSEKCPFDEIVCPNKYFGYQYGDRDWVIQRTSDMEFLSFSDLVPYQANKYGFYQGLKNPYRLDPIKFLDFFKYSKEGFASEISKVKTIETWRNVITPSMSFIGVPPELKDDWRVESGKITEKLTGTKTTVISLVAQPYFKFISKPSEKFPFMILRVNKKIGECFLLDWKVHFQSLYNTKKDDGSVDLRISTGDFVPNITYSFLI